MDKDALVAIFLAIIFIYIFAVFASVFTGPVKDVALSMINSLSLFVILILAIPPIGIIVGLIILIIKFSQNPSPI